MRISMKYIIKGNRFAEKILNMKKAALIAVLIFSFIVNFTIPVKASVNESVNVTAIITFGDAYTSYEEAKSVTLQLYKNGSKYGRSVNITSGDNWEYEWKALPSYENRKEIAWTVEVIKTNPSNYETMSSRSTAGGVYNISLKPVSKSSNYGNNSEYIFEDSSRRYLTSGEVSSLSVEDIRIAINEIYARHGYIFSDPELKSYFNSRSWYKGTTNHSDFDESVFNKYEKKNIALLDKYRNNGGSSSRGSGGSSSGGSSGSSSKTISFTASGSYSSVGFNIGGFEIEDASGNSLGSAYSDDVNVTVKLMANGSVVESETTTGEHILWGNLRYRDYTISISTTGDYHIKVEEQDLSSGSECIKFYIVTLVK